MFRHVVLFILLTLVGFIKFSEKKLKKVWIHFVGVASFFSGSKIFTREGVFHCLTCTALKQKYYLLVLQNFRWVNNSCHPVMFLLLANICCDPNFESGVLATAQCVVFFLFLLTVWFFVHLIHSLDWSYFVVKEYVTKNWTQNSACSHIQFYFLNFWLWFYETIKWVSN